MIIILNCARPGILEESIDDNDNHSHLAVADSVGLYKGIDIVDNDNHSQLARATSFL